MDPRAAPPDALAIAAARRLARGDVLGALAGWRAARQGALGRWGRPFAELFASVEGRGPFRDEPAPRPVEEPRTPAWAAAWAGDLPRARALGADDPGLLGVLALLARRPAEALPLLDRAIADGGPRDLVLHKARALVHLGRPDEAMQLRDQVIDDETFADRLVFALALTTLQGEGFRAWADRAQTSESLWNGLFSGELPSLFGDAAVRAALASPGALCAFLDGILDRMAGNLGPSPTFAEVGPDGPRVVRLTLPPGARHESVAALRLLRHRGLAAARAAIDEVIARRPQAAMPRLYRGELALWLGDYRAALGDFVDTYALERTRWADIGILAVLVMTDRLRAAELFADYAERRTRPVRGGTLPVYRGLLRRRLGDPARAVDDLAAAVADKPSRLGARLELVQALRAAGRREEALPHAVEALRTGAPLLVDAADALGYRFEESPGLLVSEAVLDEALASMRGNRSSILVTWFDRAGAFRVLGSPAAWQDDARRTLAALGVTA